MYYLPRDRAQASARGWARQTAADFSWPMPGDAFWRAVGRSAGDPATQVVYRRALDFYAADPPVQLLAVDGGTRPDGGGDRVAYLVQAGTHLLALTGSSNVIHELNEKLGGTRAGFELDYVEFFCSFVAGDEGPFVVPRTNVERDEVAAQDPFLEHAQRLRERLVLGTGPATPAPPREESPLPAARLEFLEGPALEQARAAAAAAGWDASAGTTLARAHVLYGNGMFAATFAVARGGVIEMLEDDPLLALQTATRHRFVEEGGTSWLLRDWSGSERERIDASEFLTRVRAAGNDPGGDACGAPLSHLEVTGDVVFPPCRPVSWLHCFDVDFRGSVFLDDCHATDRVDFQSCRFLGSFSARRATFDKSFALRRCQVLALCAAGGRAAALEQDRWGSGEFGGPVAVCLDSSRIAIDLDLERTTCHASLRARRLVAGGNASLSGLRVLPTVVPVPSTPPAPPADSALPKFAASASPALLDLSDDEIGGSVALNCALDHAAIVQFGRFAPCCHRPIVVGTLRLDGVRIGGSLWIRGLGVLRVKDTRGAAAHEAQFTLRQARIAGGLQNYEHLAHPMPPTRILGEVDASFAELGNYAQFDGFYITGDLEFGALTAQSIGLSAEWNFTPPASDGEHGGAEPWFEYHGGEEDAVIAGWRPCQVGGNVNFNNARISGTVFATGVRIAGTLRARDGAQLGSLLLRPGASLLIEPQPDGSAMALQRHRARVGTIDIDTAQFAGTVAIVETDVDQCATISNSQVAGDLDLFGQQAMLRQIEGHLRTHYTWQDPNYPIADWVEGRLGRVPPCTRFGYGAVPAQGALRVCGTSIGGSVDLRNVRVRDDLCLEDTRIGGDLMTAQPRVLGGVGQRAFQADEGGQRALMPMLDLEGCSAAALDVHGECIGFTDDAAPDVDAGELAIRTECSRFIFDTSECRGDARLWRLLAHRSVSGRHAQVRGALSFFVPGMGVGPLPAAVESREDRRVNFERARFEQLTIVEPFPPYVYLRGIHVGQWSPKAGSQAQTAESGAREVNWRERTELMLKILERTPEREIEPAVYLDVERYFRASGQDGYADEIYRALRDRQASEEEATCGSVQALWLWLAVLGLPLLVVLASLAGFVDGARWGQANRDAATHLGLLIGLLAPWLLAWANPPRPAGQGARRSGLGGLDGRVPRGLLRLAIMLAVALLLFLSTTVQIVVTIAALTFWIHLLLLVPALVASNRLRALVFGRLLQRLGTGWGTSPHRLVLVWLLLLFAPLAIVLHEPRNVEPTILARSGLGLPADAAPTPASWRWEPLRAPPTWFWMAVESTIPIISIEAEDEWEASKQPPLVLGCGPGVGACRDAVVPFGTSAKQVETFLRLIGWLFWPLAAAGFAASFIHRRQSANG